jgi:DnaJ-class molecular chaperone
MGVYKKRYDPEKEGFGNPDEWRDAFSARMGLNKARETLGSKDPFVVLGIAKTATWDEIKKAHRAAVMKHHPDRNPGDEEAADKFKDAQAAFEILEDRYGG